MPFTPPSREELKTFSVAGITDLAANATNQMQSLRASISEETVTDEQLTQLEELQAFVAAAADELKERQDKATRLAAASTIPELPATPAEPEPVVAAAETAVEPEFNAEGNKDVAATVVTADIANTAVETVEATVTAAGGTANAPRRAVGIADAAPYAPAPEVLEGDNAYTIVAAADIASFPTGSTLDYKSIGRAFEERVRPYGGMAKGGTKGRHQHPLAMIRREYPEGQVIMEGDSQESAFGKLKATSDSFGRQDAVVAANGWCAPSTPDYSICSPITTDGLLNLPEMVLRRGGLLHNQGLDFADFFGNDFALPIPGFNILTEAQVIADTAKTCVEIPCPEFVDDRLNVAALCLTSSLLQNRGYPEFVSEFVQGAVASLAHLVSREVMNEVVTGSTAVALTAVDPWVTDGTVWSQVFSAIDFAAMDLRYIYRASRTQTVDMIFPYWLKAALRADWLRRNATHTEELTDQMIDAALSRRNIRAQWIYNWQDAFNTAPTTPGATQQLGNATPPIALPTTLAFTAWLPGTWVLGRNDVIRLDTVYDSTNLQQNLVTQLFLEDGFKPMRMCQHSRVYTLPICSSGSTGLQRVVACTDVTP